MNVSRRTTPLIIALIGSVSFADTPVSDQVLAPEVTNDAPQSYVVVNEDVKDFIRDLSRDNAVRILTSQRVRGLLVNMKINGTLPEILDKVAGQMELDWFTHNGVIYLSDRDEALTRMIRLGDLDVDDALAELDASALRFEAFTLSAAAENSAILVTGPPRYLALVESVIEGIPSDPPDAPKARGPVIILHRGIEITEVPLR